MSTNPVATPAEQPAPPTAPALTILAGADDADVCGIDGVCA